MVDAPADPVAGLLARLPGHRSTADGQWTARCPAHDDRQASLSVTRGDDGRALVHCHAGCDAAAVCSAVGLTLADLFAGPATGTNGHAIANGHRPRIVQTYDYVGPEGELLYQKVRYDPKGFRQRRPVGNGGWSYTLGDVPRVLYRQPELNDADFGEWVYLVEGEKAADALADRGLVATCTAEGAGKWRPAYTEALRARRVAVLVDNDDPGRAHGRLVADGVLGTAADVRVVELPGLPAKGDVYDYMAAGRTAADLAAAVEATPPHAAGCPPAGDAPEPDEGDGDTPAAVTVGPSANQHTDIANARRLVAAFAGAARWNHTRERWLVYDAAAGVWAEDTAGLVEQAAKAVADGMWAAIGRLSPLARKAAVRHATRSSSAGGISAMVNLARTEPGVTVTADQLDADPWLLNVANGVIDLRTGHLRRHDPGLLLSRQAPVRYDPDATCPTFVAFMDRIMGGSADLIGYVQRLCGLLVTGDVTEQLLPLFIGVGANGKSVLVDTLLGMLGSYAGLAPPSLLTDRGGGEEHPTELADLVGRRLVVGSETEESARLKVQLVKRLTGDATVKARFMRCDYFEARRTFKVLLVTNNKPVVTEAGNAIWRRLRLVPFSVVIPEAEQDRHLLDRLRAEWPGFLAWCVRGTLDWRRDGMRTPEAVLLATAAYAAEQDVLAEYLATRTVRGDDRVRVGRSELWADYQSWAGQTGEKHPLARHAFFERVRKLAGVSDGQWRPVGVTVPVRGFRGIGLAAVGGAG